MKKTLLLLLASTMLLSGCASLVPPGGHQNPEDEKPEYEETETDVKEEEISQEQKDAFKKLDVLESFGAEITNASSLGLQKKKQTNSRAAATGDFETTQTLVKTTTEYNSNDPKVNADGTLDVTFTKIDTTVTTKITDGAKNLTATIKSNDNNEVTFIEYGSDYIKIETDTKHAYRLIDTNGLETGEWIDGTGLPLCFNNLRVVKSFMPKDLVLKRRITYINEDPTKNYSTLVGGDFFADALGINIEVYESGDLWDDYIDVYDEYKLETTYGDVVFDWKKFDFNDAFEKDYMHYIHYDLDFNEGISSNNYSVRARSLDAEVTMNGYKGFTYSLYKGNTCLRKDVKFEEIRKTNKTESLISFDGLVEGEKYRVDYHGVGEEITVEQKEVGGEIDKTYVYNSRFTFVSFVPYGTSKRPTDDQMKYNKDGIAKYDLIGYRTNSTRQSFIFDNESGLIYPIVNFNIRQIYNGLLFSEDDKFVYDFKVNKDNNLEIYALSTNKDLVVFDCWKDKYNNIFVVNNVINEEDKINNSFFFVPNDRYLYIDTYIRINSEFESFDELEEIFLTTETGNETIANFREEALNTIYGVDTIPYGIYKNVSYYLSNEQVTISIKENSNVYKFNKFSNCLTKEDILATDIFTFDNLIVGKIKNLKFFGNFDGCNSLKENRLLSIIDLSGDNYRRWLEGFYLYDYLFKYDLLLSFMESEGTLFAFNPFLIPFDAWGSGVLEDNDIEWYKGRVVCENCSAGEDGKSILKYGINGNTYYVVVVEEVNGEIVINSYEKDKYIAPSNVVILQPIKR